MTNLPLGSHPWLKILLAGLWFFLIMFAYYMLKTLRDALASPAAVYLNWLYLGTFLGTLGGSAIYSAVVSRATREQLVFWTTQFFAVWLAGFWLLLDFHGPGIGGDLWRFLRLYSTDLTNALTGTHIFFVWVSVFNMFVVAVFWSVAADSFTPGEGKAWFGVIAAGGSTGSVIASWVAGRFAKRPELLIASSLMLLELALVVALLLMYIARRASWQQALADATQPSPEQSTSADQLSDAKSPVKKLAEQDEKIGGSLLEGLQRVVESRLLLLICIYVVLGKFAATFIYNNLQASLNAEMPELNDRLALFANMSFWTQLGSLICQGVVAGLVMRFAGVGWGLALPGIVLLGLFGWLSVDASLTVLVIAQVTQQIVGYGLMTPAQHVLFTVVPRQDKYQSKGFMDTVVFRFSDVLASNFCRAMEFARLTLSQMSVGMMTLSIAWLWLAYELGMIYRAKANSVDQVE